MNFFKKLYKPFLLILLTCNILISAMELREKPFDLFWTSSLTEAEKEPISLYIENLNTKEINQENTLDENVRELKKALFGYSATQFLLYSFKERKNKNSKSILRFLPNELLLKIVPKNKEIIRSISQSRYICNLLTIILTQQREEQRFTSVDLPEDVKEHLRKLTLFTNIKPTDYKFNKEDKSFPTKRGKMDMIYNTVDSFYGIDNLEYAPLWTCKYRGGYDYRKTIRIKSNSGSEILKDIQVGQGSECRLGFNDSLSPTKDKNFLFATNSIYSKKVWIIDLKLNFIFPATEIERKNDCDKGLSCKNYWNNDFNTIYPKNSNSKVVVKMDNNHHHAYQIPKNLYECFPINIDVTLTQMLGREHDFADRTRDTICFTEKESDFSSGNQK